MRIDHRALIDIGACVDKHWGHTDYGRSNKSAAADGRAAWNQTHAVSSFKVAGRIGDFVYKGESSRMPLVQGADSKPDQNALFYPAIYMPSAVTIFRSADFPVRKSFAKALEGGVRLRDLMGPASSLKEPLDIFPQGCSRG